MPQESQGKVPSSPNSFNYVFIRYSVLPEHLCKISELYPKATQKQLKEYTEVTLNLPLPNSSRNIITVNSMEVYHIKIFCVQFRPFYLIRLMMN